MNREQMEKATRTLIEKSLRQADEIASLRARVEKLEEILGAAVKVTPEEAQKLLAGAASQANSPAEGGGSDGKGQPDVAEGT